MNVQAQIFSNLSERQAEAVRHTDGPLLIVAGPGSGKTRVMAHRIAYLAGVHGVAPWRILAVTFTNKAARELRERAEALVGGDNTGLQIRTFHSFCSQVLRRDGGRVGLDPQFTIYDSDDQQRLVRTILEELELDPKQFAPRSILSAISDAKNKLIDDARYRKSAQSYFEEVVGRVYEQYNERLSGANAVDFDDLLLRAHSLFEGHTDTLEEYQDRYRHLLVDEFQDTNGLQFSLAKMLAGKRRNICVVGDPDQSIYSWRHADIRNLTDFQAVYPDARVVTLDQSYRSTQTILDDASGLIAKNSERLPKDLWTDNDRGNAVVVGEAYDEDEEARVVLTEINRLVEEEGFTRPEIAVMYRTNAQSRAMEAACNRYGIAYQLVGGTKFYERKEVRDLLAYLRLVVNPADDAALERIINTPARGISPKTVEAIRSALEPLGLFRTTPVRHFGEEHLRAVHDPGLLNFLREVCRKLSPDRPVYPYVFPVRRANRRPRDLTYAAGYYCIDTFTPISREAFTAARGAVDCVLSAADAVLSGERLAYALVRPPGHHAERGVFGGFCYYANAAAAAERFSREGSVA
ncbi:MAG: UvrD-helicase domain-containing protein, partial [Chloroflexota bacterium]